MGELNLARLRAARERENLTQVELSKLLGLSEGLAGQWERGYKEPSLAKLKQLASVLRVSLPWLLGMDDPAAIGEPPHRYSEADDPEPRRHRYTSPADILADYDAPIGLRDLAQDRDLTASLRITPDEWAALGSLDYAGGLTREGYCGLLVMLRTASLQASRGSLEDRPGRKAGHLVDTA